MFYAGSSITIDLVQRISSVTCNKREMVFQFQLLGDQKYSDIFEELSECIRFLGENLTTSQAEFSFDNCLFTLEKEKRQFLLESINEVRKEYSGRDIQQPFGLESCGKNRPLLPCSLSNSHSAATDAPCARYRAGYTYRGVQPV